MRECVKDGWCTSVPRVHVHDEPAVVAVVNRDLNTAVRRTLCATWSWDVVQQFRESVNDTFFQYYSCSILLCVFQNAFLFLNLSFVVHSFKSSLRDDSNEWSWHRIWLRLKLISQIMLIVFINICLHDLLCVSYPSATELSAILFLLFARSSSNSPRSFQRFRWNLRRNFNWIRQQIKNSP